MERDFIAGQMADARERRAQAEAQPENQMSDDYDKGYWDCTAILEWGTGFEHGLSNAAIDGLRDLFADKAPSPRDYRTGWDSRISEGP